MSDLTLTIDGVEYTAEKLNGIAISKSVDGIGTSGISTTQLSGCVYTSVRFTQGTKVVISYAAWEFPEYYIDTSDFDGTSVSFTAYDLCKNLDLPFDNSAYTEMEYETSFVIDNIAHQAGFTGADNISVITTIPTDDLDGSMRQILQRISEANCGIFCCSNDNRLKFVAVDSLSSATAISNHSILIEKSVKSIAQIYTEDTRNNVTYKYGNGDYKNTLFLSGDYLSENISQSIASRLFAVDGGKYEHIAFSVDSAVINSNLEICGYAYFPNGKQYKCTSIKISFGAAMAVATIGAAQISESKASYMEKTMRMMEQRLKLGTKYGIYFTNKNSSGLMIKL